MVFGSIWIHLLRGTLQLMEKANFAVNCLQGVGSCGNQLLKIWVLRLVRIWVWRLTCGSNTTLP